jgi:hypothetical protein
LGSRNSGGSAIVAGTIGGVVGATGGTAYWNMKEKNACIDRQHKLDGISANFTESVRSVSVVALQQLILHHVQMNVISQADADTLMAEANKLSQRALEVFEALR